ncbi:large ribosomal subunit protein uL30 isoform X2 [Pogona vitticeps]
MMFMVAPGGGGRRTRRATCVPRLTAAGPNGPGGDLRVLGTPESSLGSAASTVQGGQARQSLDRTSDRPLCLPFRDAVRRRERPRCLHAPGEKAGARQRPTGGGGKKPPAPPAGSWAGAFGGHPPSHTPPLAQVKPQCPRRWRLARGGKAKKPGQGRAGPISTRRHRKDARSHPGKPTQTPPRLRQRSQVSGTSFYRGGGWPFLASARFASYTQSVTARLLRTGGFFFFRPPSHFREENTGKDEGPPPPPTPPRLLRASLPAPTCPFSCLAAVPASHPSPVKVSIFPPLQALYSPETREAGGPPPLTLPPPPNPAPPPSRALCIPRPSPRPISAQQRRPSIQWRVPRRCGHAAHPRNTLPPPRAGGGRPAQPAERRLPRRGRLSAFLLSRVQLQDAEEDEIESSMSRRTLITQQHKR